MQKFFEVKLKGRLEPEKHDAKQMMVLNRVLRVVDEGLLYEPDPRHVELLARDMGLPMGSSKGNATPGIKP